MGLLTRVSTRGLGALVVVLLACSSKDAANDRTGLDEATGGTTAAGGAAAGTGAGGVTQPGAGGRAQTGGSGTALPDASSPDSAPDAPTSPGDAGFEASIRCDASPPPLADGAANACTECLHERCACQVLAGGDPEVAVCLMRCSFPSQGPPPDLAIQAMQWCLAGHRPAIPPQIGLPAGLPAEDYCGGPTSATDPANRALAACGWACPCP